MLFSNHFPIKSAFLISLSPFLYLFFAVQYRNLTFTEDFKYKQITKQSHKVKAYWWRFCGYFWLEDISCFNMHFKVKLCSYPEQPSDQKSFAAGSWICLLTSMCFTLLYENHNLISLVRSCFIVMLNFPKGIQCKCEHWGFPVEWEEQGSQKSKFLNKMTLLPHAEILYFNPQVYLWQTCV